MPFFLYGNDNQMHIDHVYTASPNIQMSSDQVKIDGLINDWSERPLVYAQLPFPEVAMHPFPMGTFPPQGTPTPDDANLHSNTPMPYRFRQGERFDGVAFTADLEGKVHIGFGTITLSKEQPFVDAKMLNDDPKIELSERGGTATARTANHHRYCRQVVVSYSVLNPARYEAEISLLKTDLSARLNNKEQDIGSYLRTVSSSRHWNWRPSKLYA